MAPIIIGLGYRARNGKDSVAKEIIEQRGYPKDMPPFKGLSSMGQMHLDGRPVYDIRRYAFGDALKQEVTAAIERAGSIVELFYQMDDQLPDWVVIEPDADMADPLCPYGKYRTLLQFWGTEYRRAQDPDYWVKKVREQINAEQPQFAIVPDVRFLNEFEFVDYRVRVSRIGFTDTLANSHGSEHELDAVPLDRWSYLLDIPEGDFLYLSQQSVSIFDHLTTCQGK